MKSKILSAILSIAMVIASTTNVVFADPTVLTSTGGELSNGDYILNEDITLTSNIIINGTVSIDLNGHVLKGIGNGSVIKVNNVGNLTIKDGNPSNTHTGDFASLPAGGCITGGKGTQVSSEFLGGGVYVENGGAFTMNGGTIVGCDATKGGGVFTWGSFTMNNNSAIRNCTATIDGGGVCACNCSFIMNNNSIVSNCKANRGAGGVYIFGNTNVSSSFTMNGNSTINECEANATSSDRYGGGVCVEGNKCSFIMNSGFITNNSAKNGGGVNVFSGTFTMNGGSINNNTVTSHGGAIAVESGATANIVNGTIENNKATESGGAVQVDGNFTMTGGAIKNNSAIKDGGGLSVNGTYGIATLAGTTEIVNNTANIKGGGVSYYGNNSGKVVLGGKVKIVGNVEKGTINEGTLTGGTANNVYLYSNNLCITIGTDTYAPTEGMLVGITTCTAPVEGTPVKFTTNGTANDVKYFTSDNANYKIQHNNTSGYLELALNTQTHDNIAFTVWTNSSGLPSSAGNYYLGTDVELNATWTVVGQTNLCLNGHVIKQASSSGVINVPNGATLSLYDCGSIEHAGYVDADGLWHLGTGEGVTKTITGGIITGGHCDDGGGVIVNSGGIFNMYGGTIVGNTANNCGGGVNARGTFNMYDGVIEYNKAIPTASEYWGGGGIAIYGNGKGTLSGGVIQHNSSTVRGGGVLILFASSTEQDVLMTGVSIMNNTAETGGGGVYFDNNMVTLLLGGNTVIQNNVSGETDNNLHFDRGETITLCTGNEAPTSDMLVGVTTKTPPAGTPVKFTTNGTADDAEYFTSDNANYKIQHNNTTSGYLELANITIADILETVPGFPTTSNSGWVNENGKKIYKNLITDCIQIDKLIELNTVLQKDGQNYKYGTNYIFNMTDGKLTSITVQGLTGFGIDINGEFVPYKYTNDLISIPFGYSKGIEFVTNASYTRDEDVTVKVDGKALRQNTHYTLAHNSTHVTLKGSYVSTLPVGTHTISIGVTGSFSEIDQDFTITAVPSPTPTSDPTPSYKVPNTGVEGTTNNNSLLKLSSLSLLAIGTYLVIKKKKDN